MMRIRQGLSKPDDKSQFYRIDVDLFVSSRKEAKDVPELLDKLNRTAGNFFRWAIKKKLSHALEPTLI